MSFKLKLFKARCKERKKNRVHSLPKCDTRKPTFLAQSVMGLRTDSADFIHPFKEIIFGKARTINFSAIIFDYICQKRKFMLKL